MVDKAPGPSSFAVVKRVRSLLGNRREKVGHGGTLDPFASGVLPICIGEATKVLPYLLDADKTYQATIQLGVETDTLDRTGRTVFTHHVPVLSEKDISDALAPFRGPIEQVPPMFSALKRDGRPLYAYARAGQSVARQPRHVVIHTLDLLAYLPPDRLSVRVRCSKGTYVRSLAADIGQHLGVGAHLQELRRTASGPFSIAQAVTLEQLTECVAKALPLPMLSVLDALVHVPKVTVNETQALALSRGQRLAWAALAHAGDSPGPVCAIRTGESGPIPVAMIAPAVDGTVKILRGFRS